MTKIEKNLLPDLIRGSKVEVKKNLKKISASRTEKTPSTRSSEVGKTFFAMDFLRWSLD